VVREEGMRVCVLQEGSKIGDLDGMPSRHPPKIVGVASECQESRSILTSSRPTLYLVEWAIATHGMYESLIFNQFLFQMT